MDKVIENCIRTQRNRPPYVRKRKGSFYGALISLDGDFSRLDVVASNFAVTITQIDILATDLT